MSGLDPMKTKKFLRDIGTMMGDLIKVAEEYSEEVEDQTDKSYLEDLVSRARDLEHKIGDAIINIAKGPPE